MLFRSSVIRDRGKGRSWLTAPWSEFDPLSRRLLQIVAILCGLLVFVVVDALVHPDDGTHAPGPNPIALAAKRTQQAAGARSVIQAVYSSPALDPPLTMNGRGVYAGGSGRSRTTMTIQVPSPLGALQAEAIGDEQTVYLRSPQLSKRLPPGRKWIGVDPWLGRTAETAFAGNGDVRAQLELLAAANGDVETVGVEEVRGVQTTRFRGGVDLARYAAVLNSEGKNGEALRDERLARLVPSTTTVEAWIGDDDLLRRVRILTSIPDTPSQSSISMDMRIDFFDFGTSPVVHLPVAGDVFDVTPLVRAEQGLLTGESLGTVIQPVGKRPLSVDDFHRQAGSICAELFSHQDSLEHRAEGPMKALRRLGQAGGSDEAAREGILRAYRRAAYSFFVPALHIAERGLYRLGRLVPPRHLTSAYNEYLLAGALSAEATQAEVRALEAGDFDVAQRLQQQIRIRSAQNDRRARRLGLGKCITKDKWQGAQAPVTAAPV
jgi:hypothetical protein